ncbi:MAG TPA: cupin domain-containing protein [Pyrinomonadaceae bacterium]|nr:cupin domain-containing protein [Pyrinomonadaceae bacterium]
MAVVLEGGCRVSTMHEGDPSMSGSLRVWNQIGKATGATAISLRILEFGPGASLDLPNHEGDEVLYLERGSCTISIDGNAYEIGPETGIYLRPEQSFSVNNPGPAVVRFVSCQCPAESPSCSEASPIARLADRRALPTADRWYRVLIDEQVTQFVGSIPPGRAPDHFHEYEEVLFILRGEGRMWAGETNTPIGPGSCVYLPRRQVHCVENTGNDELRLLGVFYPAGSPAVRYET